MNREHSTIELYVGQIPKLIDANCQSDEVGNAKMEDRDHDENLDMGDRGHDEDKNDKTNDENAVNERDGNDLYDSNFEFFLDGDDLNDGYDPINEGEIAEEMCLEINIPNYDEYVQLINDEYDTYVESKRKAPGRPKKVRRKASDEDMHSRIVTKKGIPIHCSQCDHIDHNVPTTNMQIEQEALTRGIARGDGNSSARRGVGFVKTSAIRSSASTVTRERKKDSKQTTQGPVSIPVGDTSKPLATALDDNPAFATTTLKKTSERKERSVAATGVGHARSFWNISDKLLVLFYLTILIKNIKFVILKE
ncbi:hypothetical protein ACH5RR_008108 [Cinchona calisaya]|uniref:Uncharacterized protein n=1 Tax=Cinchona calisaya TaxID=153742 RepID=A0ABD3AAL1_9GENT